uniref:Uncharacterized protein n=1 Tax=Murine herpesvirus TaxID=1431748 RepID=A0A6M4EKC0_9BETA
METETVKWTIDTGERKESKHSGRAGAGTLVKGTEIVSGPYANLAQKKKHETMATRKGQI